MKLIMKISGMHCGSCCANIERSLSKIEGINSAKANLEENEVRISYDDGKVKLESIRKIIRKIGFMPGAEKYE